MLLAFFRLGGAVIGSARLPGGGRKKRGAGVIVDVGGLGGGVSGPR